MEHAYVNDHIRRTGQTHEKTKTTPDTGKIGPLKMDTGHGDIYKQARAAITSIQQQTKADVMGLNQQCATTI